MFLKKSSEMFRRKSIVSVALNAQQLYCEFSSSKPRAKTSTNSLKKGLENILSKVTGRRKRQEQNTDKKDNQENNWIKSAHSKFSTITWKNLFSKIALGKPTSTRQQQSNLYPRDSGIPESFITCVVSPNQEFFDSDLLDKDFQCTSATARYLSELCEKGDIVTLKYHLHKSGHYNMDNETEFSEISSDTVSVLKYEVSISSTESLKQSSLSEQPVDFDLIDKDFQCTSATARYLSDLVEIDPSIIVTHGLYEDSLYNYDIDELKVMYSFDNRMF